MTDLQSIAKSLETIERLLEKYPPVMRVYFDPDIVDDVENHYNLYYKSVVEKTGYIMIMIDKVGRESGSPIFEFENIVMDMIRLILREDAKHLITLTPSTESAKKELAEIMNSMKENPHDQSPGN